jgi:hypothetical protein
MKRPSDYDTTTPRRTSDGAEFPCCQDCCYKKDCAFPLLIHLSPPGETGTSKEGRVCA